MAIGVYCLDVGQGQCIALIGLSPDGYEAALIDVGADGERLAGWLEGIGVRRIPLVVLTHNHADHIKGLTSLVEAFARDVGDVRFVVDQPPDEIPFWMRIQGWLGLGKIRSAGVVYPPETSEPGWGLPLCESSLVGFRLSCIYPTVFEAAAVAHGAPLVGTHPGRGANVVSAIIRLARAGEPERTIALCGGDLTFRGWRRLDEKGHDLSAEVLVVPHHGSDRGTSPDFGPQELARAVRPRFALFSVGTDNTYGHPAAEIVGAFGVVGATVLCTQITGRCVDRPDGIPGRAVLAPDPSEPALANRGVPCAGTIVVRVPDLGPVEVIRLTDHQAAVDRLPRTTVHPMCRT
jgi:competence protein ComEC